MMPSRLCAPARIALGAWLLAAAGGSALAAVDLTPRIISRADYADRMRAFWLGECIANWTGLRTEGMRLTAPFLTDADWGMLIGGYPLEFVTWQSPWLADDDTDIEYVYLDELSLTGGVTLTPGQIASAWTDHINRYIWVSNAEARRLIGRGVLPPATGLGTANFHRLMIDAQLTTEIAGLLAPGMPWDALRLGDGPVRTTSSGYACHASQFYIVLYSLALQVPADLAARDRAVWLVAQARRYLPDGSKSADIADFILADFLANPDPDDWESTRDRFYVRFQRDAALHGYRYRDWYESSVNFGTGLIALLYGGGDFRRTVQIGTLSGWDSDNGTATMGGLVAAMLGTAQLAAQFPGIALADTYDILRTRDGFPDRTPGIAGQDTLTMMAERMLPIVERRILDAGGRIDAARGVWLLPPAPGGDALTQSPTWDEDRRSANNRVPRAGGAVNASSSLPPGAVPDGRGSPSPWYFANGHEQDFRGLEVIDDSIRAYYSSQGSPPPPDTPVTLTVTYDRPVEVSAIRFIEGDHFADALSSGGWFTSAAVQARIDGAWVVLPAAPSQPLDPARPFQIIDFVLSAPVWATGIRIAGPAGGAHSFVTCAELDALSPTSPIGPTTGRLDVSGDGAVDWSDLGAWDAAHRDLDGDGVADSADRRFLVAWIRWLKGIRPAGPARMAP
ncbi:MAG: ADP-ribosylglycohydrolase family protein [Phycisphaerales bacterium]|nr:ADP-ribosylglycohydrolase family protein [Phycisphaerales bacterium]